IWRRVDGKRVTVEISGPCTSEPRKSAQRCSSAGSIAKLFDANTETFSPVEIVYSPPQYPGGTRPSVVGAAIVESTIGRDAREMSARFGDFRLAAGVAC